MELLVEMRCVSIPHHTLQLHRRCQVCRNPPAKTKQLTASLNNYSLFNSNVKTVLPYASESRTHRKWQINYSFHPCLWKIVNTHWPDKITTKWLW